MTRAYELCRCVSLVGDTNIVQTSLFRAFKKILYRCESLKANAKSLKIVQEKRWMEKCVPEMLQTLSQQLALRQHWPLIHHDLQVVAICEEEEPSLLTLSLRNIPYRNT